jgi:hypothetical protein
MELLVYCGMRLLYRARLPWRMRFFESQQSGIVAQIFSLERKSSHEFSFANTIQNPKVRACQVSKM